MMYGRMLGIATLVVVSVSPAWAESGTVPGSGALQPDAVPVEIRREKPEKVKLPSLVFLEENLDFLRAQIDGVYWQREARSSQGAAIDPRWLEYLEMRDSLDAAARALAAEDADLASERLLESVGELAAVEERLGELSRLLDEHGERLDVLHADYVEDHLTSLVLVARGVPAEPLGAIRVRYEDGRESELALDADLQEILRIGGVVELGHDFIEPRTQWVQLVFPAVADREGFSAYLEVSPQRDRLQFVELDLGSFRAEESPSTWVARTWSRPSRPGSQDWNW